VPARHILSTARPEFPTAPSGTLAYRQQLLKYLDSDPVRAARRKARPLRITDKTTIRNVFKRLSRVLDREGLNVEYFSPSFRIAYPDTDYVNNPESKVDGAKEWNRHKFRAVSVWPVTGGSEGVYIHVDFVGPADPNARLAPGDQLPRFAFALGKVWTWPEAWAMCRRIVELLDV
jgi:hypothetical protein